MASMCYDDNGDEDCGCCGSFAIYCCFACAEILGCRPCRRCCSRKDRDLDSPDVQIRDPYHDAVTKQPPCPPPLPAQITNEVPFQPRLTQHFLAHQNTAGGVKEYNRKLKQIKNKDNPEYEYDGPPKSMQHEYEKFSQDVQQPDQEPEEPPSRSYRTGSGPVNGMDIAKWASDVTCYPVPQQSFLSGSFSKSSRSSASSASIGGQDNTVPRPASSEGSNQQVQLNLASSPFSQAASSPQIRPSPLRQMSFEAGDDPEYSEVHGLRRIAVRPLQSMLRSSAAATLQNTTGAFRLVTSVGAESSNTPKNTTPHYFLASAQRKGSMLSNSTLSKVSIVEL